MAQFLKKAFQIHRQNLLLYQQKRFRGKINIQKPRPPHYTRQLVGEFLTPFYVDPNKDKTNAELCLRNVKNEKKEAHPYEMILAREIRNWFDNSNMIAFLHKNSIKADEVFDLAVPLKRNNMYLKIYGERLVRLALDDSPYKALEPLYSCKHFLMIFSPDTNVSALRKIIRKFPQVILLAGVLNGKLLHCEDFIRYGEMDLTTARSGLVQVLQNAAGNNLCRQLTHHQSTLVSRLRQISKSETPPDANE